MKYGSGVCLGFKAEAEEVLKNALTQAEGFS